jgi:hypothetical protein
MANDSPLSVRDAAPFETALRYLLPSREQALLLAACLRDDDEAAHAWMGFVAEVDDPRSYFESDRTGLKGMLPFIEASLARNDIDAGKAFHTYARVALVREELRSRIYGEILDSVLASLDAAGISAVLLKGGALSATVYPQPSTRHTHAIDLLVQPDQMVAARAVLSMAQFAAEPANPGAAFHQDFRHTTGLALGLHTKLLFLPHFEMPLDGIRARTRSIAIRSSVVRVLSAEDALVHVCGHAAYARSRANLRWACDAFYLLQSNPNLNWPVLIDMAARSRTTLLLLVLLRWVAENLAAPIPSERIDELRDASRQIDAVTAEGIYAALLHTTLSRGVALSQFAASWRAQLGFLEFSAFPSPLYMRWRHNVNRAWKLPLYYADRPRRLALRLAGRASRESGRDETVDGSVKEGAA